MGFNIKINSCSTKEDVTTNGVTTVVAHAGYEADDIIYSAVKKYYDRYDKIHIYTGDSDMAFLIDEKVDICPASSRAKHITRDNYEEIAIRGGATVILHSCRIYSATPRCILITGSCSRLALYSG